MQSQSVWSPSRIAAKSTARRRSSYYVTLNLWPFVSVMVALLILFMVHTTTPHYHSGHPVDLPRARHAIAQPSAIREDSIRISIPRDGRLFFRNYQIQPQELSGMIRDAVKSGSEKKAYIAVDARTKYGDVTPV